MLWNVRLICINIKTFPRPNITSLSHDIGPYNSHATFGMVRHPIHAKSILIYRLLIYCPRVIINFNRPMFIPTIKEQEQRIIVEEENNIDNKRVETIETGKVFIREEEKVVKSEEYQA